MIASASRILLAGGAVAVSATPAAAQDAGVPALMPWAITGMVLFAVTLAASVLITRWLGRQVQARTSALEQSEARYRQLVENASDIIYLTDAEGRFTFTNPASQRITGFSEVELLAMRYVDLVDPTWRERVGRFYARGDTVRDGGGYFEFPIRTKAGRQIWVGQHVRTMQTGARSGAITGWHGTSPTGCRSTSCAASSCRW